MTRHQSVDWGGYVAYWAPVLIMLAVALGIITLVVTS